MSDPTTNKKKKQSKRSSKRKVDVPETVGFRRLSRIARRWDASKSAVSYEYITDLLTTNGRNEFDAVAKQQLGLLCHWIQGQVGQHPRPPSPSPPPATSPPPRTKQQDAWHTPRDLAKTRRQNEEDILRAVVASLPDDGGLLDSHVTPYDDRDPDHPTSWKRLPPLEEQRQLLFDLGLDPSLADRIPDNLTIDMHEELKVILQTPSDYDPPLEPMDDRIAALVNSKGAAPLTTPWFADRGLHMNTSTASSALPKNCPYYLKYAYRPSPVFIATEDEPYDQRDPFGLKHLNLGARTVLYYDKLGVFKSFEGNEATRHGQLWEPMALLWLRLRFSREPIFTDLGLTKRDAWASGSKDGLSWSGVLAEAKSPFSRFIKKAEHMWHYYPQIQYMMWIDDLHECQFVEYRPPTLRKSSSANGAPVFETNVKKILLYGSDGVVYGDKNVGMNVQTIKILHTARNDEWLAHYLPYMKDLWQDIRSDTAAAGVTMGDHDAWLRLRQDDYNVPQGVSFYEALRTLNNPTELQADGTVTNASQIHLTTERAIRHLETFKEVVESSPMTLDQTPWDLMYYQWLPPPYRKYPALPVMDYSAPPSQQQ